MSFSLLVVSATAAAVLAVAAPASANVAAIAYQLTAGHTGYTPDAVNDGTNSSGGTGPLVRWRTNLGGSISYPLIWGGLVYVTVASNGNKLYALSAATGAVKWGPVELGGSYSWTGLSQSGGQIDTVNSDGVMEGFNATTGQLEWASQLPTQWMFSSPPTSAGGYVYTGGAGDGGTVYGVRQSNGSLAWTAPVMNGDSSSPAVTGTGVYVSYACAQTYDLNPTTGAQIWWHSTSCEGGGGYTPVLAHGRLYVRDSSFPSVLSASNGRFLGPFEAGGPPPAVDTSQLYDLIGSTLTATSLSTGFDTWTFKGDGTLASAPIVAGGTVMIGSSSGRLYGLNSSTGKLLWVRSLGGAVAPTNEGGVSAPTTGLAASNGLIVAPAGTTLVALK